MTKRDKGKFQGSKHVWFDTAAWYLFDQNIEYTVTMFFGKDTE